MFDFIHEEKHAFLKKAVGIGTLFGAVLETAVHASTDPLLAGSSGIVGLFIFLWLLDVAKDAAKEGFQKLGEYENEEFAATKNLRIDLTSPPTGESLAILRQELTYIVDKRFPRDMGAEITDYSDDRFMFRTRIERGFFCGCEIAVRLRSGVEGVVSSRSITPDPEIYLGTLDVTAKRTSTVRTFFGVTSGLLVILSGILKAAESESAQPVAAITFLWCLVAIIGVLVATIRAHIWFPNRTMAELRSDIEGALRNAGLIPKVADQTVPPRALEPFWTPKRKWTARQKVTYTSIAPLVSVIALIAYYSRPKPTVEDARKAMAAGAYDYATVKEILRPFADDGNKEAQCLLEAAATQHYDYDSLGHLADLGNATAQFELGARGVESSSGTLEDVNLLKHSAEQGFRDANVMLGQYYSWEGAHHDESESRRYYLLAAEQGNNYSQWVTYDWYRKQKQLREAYYWARVCVEVPTESRLKLYPESCQEDAQTLRLRLSKDDIAREEQLVAAFAHQKKSEVTSSVPCKTP